MENIVNIKQADLKVKTLVSLFRKDCLYPRFYRDHYHHLGFLYLGLFSGLEIGRAHV